MKKITFLFLLIISSISYSQEQSDMCGPVFSIEGEMPENIQLLRGMTGALRGGREITNQGTLRVLVVFIRFKDDRENTPTWTDYRILPNWAKTIVDTTVPLNGFYTSGNLSDFFDRASGGDGNGNLGSFRLIGDVYYDSTDYNYSNYTSPWGSVYYDSVNAEILNKLDSRIDYTKYDNWRFMINNKYYNHEYLPGVGDDKIDYVFIFYRRPSRDYAGRKEYDIPWNFIKDGKLFNRYGSHQMGYKYHGGSKVTITIPAHEFTHYLFGGFWNDDAHLDGRTVYSGIPNIGNVAHFALMLSSASQNSFFSAYERYRAGWLNPTVIELNQSSLFLKDTHIRHEAFLIPLKYDNSNPQNIVEYFIIENFHTRNDYATANPFIISQLFDQVFTHGILVFHIEEENLNIPTNSNLDIECADGLWNFYLSAGSSTPYDRSDDVLAKYTPSYSTGYDERDVITLTVGPKTWTDYYCLTPSSFGPNPPLDHGRRYHRDASIGDNYDLFKLNYATVFTRWSNPTSNRADGQITNKGFEVKSYNSTLKEYELSVQVNYDGILALSPSKPQNLKLSIIQLNGESYPRITWQSNQEPDVISNGYYEIWRRISYGSWSNWSYIRTYSSTTTEFIDSTIYGAGAGPNHVEYKIRAKDTQGLFSVYSDVVGTAWGLSQQKSPADQGINVVYVYKLYENFPNPFNPTTKIKFTIPNSALTTLKVYDLLGREIATLINEPKEAGEYQVEFNASKYGLSSGVYFYQLRAGSFTATKKFVYLR